MGCDISQINIIWDDAKKAYKIDGISLDDGDDDMYGYSSELIPELVPGRWYSIFGVLAGVRSKDFEIEDKETGYPDVLPPALAKKIDEAMFHSPTWYHLPQLAKGLDWAASTCEKSMKLARTEVPDYADSSAEAEDRSVVNMLRRMQGEVLGLEKTLGQTSWEKSIILFLFDS